MAGLVFRGKDGLIRGAAGRRCTCTLTYTCKTSSISAAVSPYSVFFCLLSLLIWAPALWTAPSVKSPITARSCLLLRPALWPKLEQHLLGLQHWPLDFKVPYFCHQVMAKLQKRNFLPGTFKALSGGLGLVLIRFSEKKFSKWLTSAFSSSFIHLSLDCLLLFQDQFIRVAFAEWKHRYSFKGPQASKKNKKQH